VTLFSCKEAVMFLIDIAIAFLCFINILECSLLACYHNIQPYLVMKKFAKYFLILILAIVVIAIGGISYVKTALPNVGAAPVLHVPLTIANIERGKYLVTSVAACMECHTPRDWNKLTAPKYTDSLGAGGVKFGHEFGLPGNFYSANITPFALSKYTDGELFKVITTGETKAGKPLFPLMPYLTYGTLDKEDIYAIIAYLRTLPPVENIVPGATRDFPVNILVNTMPHPAAFTKRPVETDSIAYGKYLVAFAGCADCHTPQDDKGAPIPGKDFAGGNEFHLYTGGAVHTANITPDKETGIGSWTRAQFVAAIRKYDGQTLPQVDAGSFNTIMPYAAFSKMKDSDLTAIYAYLRTVKPVNNGVVKFAAN
jgi:mono/diheme cytochrome c family protein